jgi:hypothetical protein
LIAKAEALAYLEAKGRGLSFGLFFVLAEEGDDAGGGDHGDEGGGYEKFMHDESPMGGAGYSAF